MEQVRNVRGGVSGGKNGINRRGKLSRTGAKAQQGHGETTKTFKLGWDNGEKKTQHKGLKDRKLESEEEEMATGSPLRETTQEER